MHCQERAFSAGLENAGSFIALVSASDQPLAGRVGPFGGRYITTKGDVVALGSGALLNGDLDAPVSVDEFKGDALSKGSFAWTGTLVGGGVGQEHCSDWSSAAIEVSGIRGWIEAKDAVWLDFAPAPCKSDAHLYCVEN